MDTIVNNWDKSGVLGTYVTNLGKTSSLLGYTSETENINPVAIFIEYEPELASKLIMHWIDKPNGLKIIFDGMYNIVDTFAHSMTKKSKPAKVEKTYDENMFKSLAIKKLSKPATDAITTHFYGKQPDTSPASIEPAVPKAPKAPKLKKEAYKAPKEPKVPKTPKVSKAPKAPKTTSLVSPAEKAAIKAGQARLMAGETINKAIKGAIARRAVKNATATKAMNTAGDVLASSTINRAIKARLARKTVAKMKANADAITVPIPKSRRAEKPKYKISYAAALKEWNMNHNRGMYCNPRKGSPEYNAVVALRL